ncbi:MAG: hypothetical protein RLZZ373_1396 [Pseudomonadota bacterium]|jgi:hypothetical protein
MASNSSGISADLERLGYGGPSGCIATGLHREVISEAVATRTLLAEEAGALCLFDRAAGTIYTLPTPVKGMQFEFGVSVAITTNAAKVITAAATQFLLGGVIAGNLTVAASGDVFQANGTTHVAISMNGTDTGGLIGGRIKFTALSSTVWYVEGLVVGSGTNADPFATS